VTAKRTICCERAGAVACAVAGNSAVIEDQTVRVITAVIAGAVIGAAVVGIAWWSTNRQSHTTNPARSWIAEAPVQPDNGMSNNCGYAVNMNRSGGIVVCGLNGDYVCFRPDASDLPSTESWVPAGDCPNGARDALLRAHILDTVH
jgi:hypothetical protein